MNVGSLALEWRNKQRELWKQGKIPKEDFWLIKKMEEIFPDGRRYRKS